MLAMCSFPVTKVEWRLEGNVLSRLGSPKPQQTGWYWHFLIKNVMNIKDEKRIWEKQEESGRKYYSKVFFIYSSVVDTCFLSMARFGNESANNCLRPMENNLGTIINPQKFRVNPNSIHRCFSIHKSNNSLIMQPKLSFILQCIY